MTTMRLAVSGGTHINRPSEQKGHDGSVPPPVVRRLSGPGCGRGMQRNVNTTATRQITTSADRTPQSDVRGGLG